MFPFYVYYDPVLPYSDLRLPVRFALLPRLRFTLLVPLLLVRLHYVIAGSPRLDVVTCPVGLPDYRLLLVLRLLPTGRYPVTACTLRLPTLQPGLTLITLDSAVLLVTPLVTRWTLPCDLAYGSPTVVTPTGYCCGGLIAVPHTGYVGRLRMDVDGWLVAFTLMFPVRVYSWTFDPGCCANLLICWLLLIVPHNPHTPLHC